MRNKLGVGGIAEWNAAWGRSFCKCFCKDCTRQSHGKGWGKGTNLSEFTNASERQKVEGATCRHCALADKFSTMQVDSSETRYSCPRNKYMNGRWWLGQI